MSASSLLLGLNHIFIFLQMTLKKEKRKSVNLVHNCLFKEKYFSLKHILLFFRQTELLIVGKLSVCCVGECVSENRGVI